MCSFKLKMYTKTALAWTPLEELTIRDLRSFEIRIVTPDSIRVWIRTQTADSQVLTTVLPQTP